MIDEQFRHTWNAQNITEHFSCLNEDNQIVFQSNGKIIRPEDIYTDQLARWMVSNTRENARYVHENEDIFTEHSISTYTDGERSAAMLLHLKKGGFLGRTENGVTPLPPKKKS